MGSTPTAATKGLSEFSGKKKDTGSGTAGAMMRTARRLEQRARHHNRRLAMLVLSRKKFEKIIVGNVTITVTKIRGNTVQIGIDAPKDVKIERVEK